VVADPDAAFTQLPAVIAAVASSGQMPRREWPSAQDGDPWWTQVPELPFAEELTLHGGSFIGRDWLFDEMREWIQQPQSRLLLVTGDAGVGKSAIAAQMTARLSVRGVHFCSASNTPSCRPEAWLASVVYQLAAQYESYRSEITPLGRPDWDAPPTALFRSLVSDPLLLHRDELREEEPWVFVIDGLDEAVAKTGFALPDLLADSIQRMPDWLRLVVTSRPDQAVEARFSVEGATIKPINSQAKENRKDLSDYIYQHLEGLVEQGVITAPSPEVLGKLGDLSSGSFLVAKMYLDALSDPDPECRLRLDEIGEMPRKLNGLYHRMFRTRFRSRESYEAELAPLVDCLAVAPVPVPENLLLAASGLDARTARKALRSLSQFLNRTGEGVRVFHQTLAEWLMDPDASAEFCAEPSEGDRRLGDACWREYEAGLEGMSRYAILHLSTHLQMTERWDRLAVLASDPLVTQERVYPIAVTLPEEERWRVEPITITFDSRGFSVQGSRGKLVVALTEAAEPFSSGWTPADVVFSAHGALGGTPRQILSAYSWMRSVATSAQRAPLRVHVHADGSVEPAP